jgi:DNA-binding MurR/RpiR family transcriptional regulator
MKAVVEAVQTLVQARRISIIGVAGSQPIVHYAANRFFRLGLDVHYYTDALLMMMAATLLSAQDVLLVISQSGATREVLEAVRVARKDGPRVIAITNNPLSPLARIADVVLITAAREPRLPYEALASRLCQMSIIDALFTLIYREQPEKAQESLAKIEKVITKEY